MHIVMNDFACMQGEGDIHFCIYKINIIIELNRCIFIPDFRKLSFETVHVPAIITNMLWNQYSFLVVSSVTTSLPTRSMDTAALLIDLN